MSAVVLWFEHSLALFLGFPCGSAGKESTCNAGDLGLIPGWGRSSGEGKGYPLQYSGLENSMDCIVHGVTKSRTQLSNFHRERNENGPFRPVATCFPNFLTFRAVLSQHSFRFEIAQLEFYHLY